MQDVIAVQRAKIAAKEDEIKAAKRAEGMEVIDIYVLLIRVASYFECDELNKQLTSLNQQLELLLQDKCDLTHAKPSTYIQTQPRGVHIRVFANR